MTTSRSTTRKALGAAALVALLGGCGDGGDEGALGDSPAVSGQIQGWTRGAATLDTYVQDGSQLVISTPVDSSGRFLVTLPGSAALAGSLTAPDFSLGLASCTGPVAVSPATALSTLASFEVSVTENPGGETVTSIGDLRLGATAPGKTGQYTLAILYAYFSEDASASGSLSCDSWRTTVNVDVSKGWNTLRVVSLGLQIDLSSGPPPSAAAWTSDLFDHDGQCQSDDDCDLDVCDLSAGMCVICLTAGGEAESSVDCCNPTTPSAGNVICQ